MRIHRLEVTAFGPFADRQVVDFDRLSGAGLFLLHGPTGAGKTSVLDAVCFALYGRVPGARGAGHGGRLRSDHAGPGVTPSVVCEFTVSGRRFEVTRSPEWQRPKKRGSGTVREQAHVVLRERVGDRWNPLTSRMDEAGDLLGQVLGLGVDQFTKLVLLPQGDFAAFLRATAEERRPLLQKLFGTERFAGVERWLAERRRESEHQVQAARQVTARLFARAEEARLDLEATDLEATDLEAAELPEAAPDPDPESDPDKEHQAHADELERALGDPELAGRLTGEWAQAARAELAAAHAALAAADQAHEQARREHEEARAHRQRDERRAELHAHLSRLRAGGPATSRARARLVAAAHTAVLAPVLADLEDAERQLDAARRVRAEAAATARAAGVAHWPAVDVDPDPDPEAGPDPGDAPAAGLAERAGELHEELGRLAELLAAQADLAELDRRHEAGARRIDTAELHLAQAQVQLAALTERRAGRHAAGTAAAALAATLPDREGDCARARAVAEAYVRHERLAAEHQAAADELRAAIDAHQAAVAAGQELRARRLDGMAAELAAGLHEGSPCPVCGSAEHPEPARHAAAAVTAPAQERADAAEAEAAARRERVQRTVQALAERLAALQALTGGADAQRAAHDVRAAEAGLAQARQAAARVRGLAAEDEAAGARLQRLTSVGEEARAAAATGREALAEIAGRRADLRERLERGRGEDEDVASRHRRVAASAATLERWLLAGRACAEAQARHARTRQAAEHSGRAAGLDDLAVAAGAVLPEAERVRLAAAVEEYDSQLARTEAVLADLAPTGPDGQPVLDLGDLGLGPDLDALRASQSAARDELERAGERHTLAARALRALTELAADLDRHAKATGPLRRRFAVLDSVSRCAEGTGGDNALRMRLSAYVLAARLEQVAEAASVRLEAMSGGRYQLVHTDGPARGGARSGLGLAVVDGWTGVQRDPGTLSGGETFCTSLALALGLADVVQAEAGGSVIETLLVDEGFGTLDEQTLDEVMDVLDGLRSTGRSVGLVSHVADLRDRIPARLEVVKTRKGSRLVA